MAVSQNMRQNTWYDAGSRLIHGLEAGIRTFYLAKVVKYDAKKHLADLQPLANISNGQKSAQYLDVPVSENCYMIDEMLERFKPDFQAVDQNSTIGAHRGAPAHVHSHFIEHYPKKKLMRAGVPVVVAVLDRDSDNWNGNASTFNINSHRMHDANDSIVIGVLGGDFVNG